MLGRRIKVGTFTPNHTAPIAENYHSKLMICVGEFEIPEGRIRLSEISDADTARTTWRRRRSNFVSIVTRLWAG